MNCISGLQILPFTIFYEKNTSANNKEFIINIRYLYDLKKSAGSDRNMAQIVRIQQTKEEIY